MTQPWHAQPPQQTRTGTAAFTDRAHQVAIGIAGTQCPRDTTGYPGMLSQPQTISQEPARSQCQLCFANAAAGHLIQISQRGGPIQTPSMSSPAMEQPPPTIPLSIAGCLQLPVSLAMLTDIPEQVKLLSRKVQPDFMPGPPLQPRGTLIF